MDGVFSKVRLDLEEESRLCKGLTLEARTFKGHIKQHALKMRRKGISSAELTQLHAVLAKDHSKFAKLVGTAKNKQKGTRGILFQRTRSGRLIPKHLKPESEGQKSDMGESPACITSPGLQDVMTWHVLPSLELRSLAALSCSCTVLRAMAYGQDGLWRCAATAFLPPFHPALTGKDRAAVQAVMQRRFQARKNIAAGQTGEHVELASDDSTIHEALFSPCGSRVVIVSTRHLSAFSVKDGVLLWRKSREDVAPQLGLNPSGGSR
ncbi:hypothetical protein WJX73_006079 [Symbiochloris irregularis]|uniref:F-box domain-containing protein n=1 Tax=Symbiochloris irregularis TaxID=706552 RepID=A0AAW1NNA6_9CHLO